MAKKKPNTPRRKRMKRPTRLQAAKHWIPKYEGKNIVKGYKNHFGVDSLCAATELKLLGINIDDEYVKQLKQAHEDNWRINERKRLKKQEEVQIDLYSDSDEYFYYIAGHTSNGVPFGITWEEHFAAQFYYIAGYKENGKPFGITWEEFELSLPTNENKETEYKEFMSKGTPFDE